MSDRFSPTAYRRHLRRESTMAERRLWAALRGRGLCGRKFRRQHTIGPFVVDFFCPSEKLAVEVDGSVHGDILRYRYDRSRQGELESLGISVLRFDNHQIARHLDEVLDIIAANFTPPCSPPSERGDGHRKPSPSPL